MVARRRSAAACTARAAPGVEIVGVSAKSKSPSRSLTLSAPNTSIGTRTTGLPERDTLFDIRARQHRRARLFERERNARCSMSVRVRLDDSDDGGSGSP